MKIRKYIILLILFNFRNLKNSVILLKVQIILEGEENINASILVKEGLNNLLELLFIYTYLFYLNL